MTFKTLDQVDVAGKRVLVRVDLNVPMAEGAVTDATRIERSAGTLTELAAKGARVLLLSHFGRPKGVPVPEMSLAPVAKAVGEILKRDVAFAEDFIGAAAEQAVDALRPGQILVLENTRFYPGEEKNDPDFAGALARLGDLYVNDAFSAAHRAHASTEGLARALPAAAGRAMEAELKALAGVLTDPVRPVAAVIGGAKVSSKLDLLQNLVTKVDYLIIGGGMANTFLAAQGKAVGKSLCEHDLADTARAILAAADKAGCAIVLPTDVVVAKEFKAMAPNRTVSVDAVGPEEMILDIGPDSLAALGGRFETAKTLVWNGPLGAFETPPFDQGTMTAARQVAMLTKIGELTSVAGGGDTLAALNEAGAAEDFSYVSTAGGAFLEWLEGKDLPGVRALIEAA
ncbi:MAG: phosphoglycerate kinase [Pseudomonadota bacterium]